MFWGAAVFTESGRHSPRQTERVVSEGEQRLAAGEVAGTVAAGPRAWVEPGEGGAAEVARE